MYPLFDEKRNPLPYTPIMWRRRTCVNGESKKMTKKGQKKFSRISAVPVCHCHLRADCGFAELAIGKDYNCNILQRNSLASSGYDRAWGNASRNTQASRTALRDPTGE